MQLDALVCLVSGSGHTVFFSVCDPKPSPPRWKKDKENNEAAVLSEADKAYNRKSANVPSLYENSERAALVLTMVDFKSQDLRWMSDQLGSDTYSSLAVVEFPNTLLPSFKPILQALQRMSQTLDLPFQDLIAPTTPDLGNLTLDPPAYAQRQGFSYNLTPLTGGEALTFTPGQPFNHEELRRMTSLDAAQQDAVIHALSNRMALIQGPPGTGKSFTG